MKALSIRQPWAEMIVTGKKSIEIRSWRPVRMELPQKILIHAGKKVDRGAFSTAGVGQSLAKGAVIGEVMMVGIRKYELVDQWIEDLDLHRNRQGGFREGLFGYILSEPVKFPAPVPFKGQLGFFEISRHFSSLDRGF